MKQPKTSEIPKAAPLAIVCHPQDVELEPDDAAPITPDDTRDTADRLAVWRSDSNPFTNEVETLARLVFGPDWTPPTDYRKGTDAERHIIGLVALLLRAKSTKTRVIAKYPETYLHPKQQANLGDLLIHFAKL